MGAADVIPGVSGGTIAFISGIYEELLASIKSINISNLKLLLQRGGIPKFWKSINGTFLASLFSGILLSIFTLASAMQYLLKEHPIWVWSFFFGLIVSSSWLVVKKIKAMTMGVGLAIAVGIVVAYFITVASPAETPSSYWFIFLSGAIAICAMILPGISGSFILVLLSKYSFVLGAVSTLNVPILATFAGGALVGIVAFSNVLTWLLRRYHDITVGLLAGFMVGALNKVWPWKQVVQTTIDGQGNLVAAVERSVHPATFEAATGMSPMVGSALFFMVAGMLLIITVEAIAQRLSRIN